MIHYRVNKEEFKRLDMQPNVIFSTEFLCRKLAYFDPSTRSPGYVTCTECISKLRSLKNEED